MKWILMSFMLMLTAISANAFEWEVAEIGGVESVQLFEGGEV